MTQTERDIEAASSIIEGKMVKDPYQKIYRTQTKNSRELFKNLSSHWENSLFIGGSADQFLNAILYGSRNLTIVDSNPLAIHYILLKLASLQQLNNKGFLAFTSWNLKEDLDLQQLLNQLESLLDKNYPYFQGNPVQFWRALFTNYSREEIAQNLFYDESIEYENCYVKEAMRFRNPYLEKRFFSYLKKVLPLTNIQIINQDIQAMDTIYNLPSLDKVYLSNILLDMNLSLEAYQRFLCEKIYPLLSFNGEAVVAYLDFSHTYGADLNNLGTIDQIIDFFTEQGCRSELLLEPNIQNQIHVAFVYQKKR